MHTYRQSSLTGGLPHLTTCLCYLRILTQVARYHVKTTVQESNMLVTIVIHICIIFLGLQRVDGQTVSRNLLRNGSETDDIGSCPPWFFTSNKCECFHHPDIKVDVLCTETEALLSFGSCMTHNDTEGITSVGPCEYFLVHNQNVTNKLSPIAKEYF